LFPQIALSPAPESPTVEVPKPKRDLNTGTTIENNAPGASKRAPKRSRSKRNVVKAEIVAEDSDDEDGIHLKNQVPLRSRNPDSVLKKEENQSEEDAPLMKVKSRKRKVMNYADETEASDDIYQPPLKNIVSQNHKAVVGYETEGSDSEDNLRTNKFVAKKRKVVERKNKAVDMQALTSRPITRATHTDSKGTLAKAATFEVDIPEDSQLIVRKKTKNSGHKRSMKEEKPTTIQDSRGVRRSKRNKMRGSSDVQITVSTPIPTPEPAIKAEQNNDAGNAFTVAPLVVEAEVFTHASEVHDDYATDPVDIAINKDRESDPNDTTKKGRKSSAKTRVLAKKANARKSGSKKMSTARESAIGNDVVKGDEKAVSAEATETNPT
jgi:hypothetical protein